MQERKNIATPIIKKLSIFLDLASIFSVIPPVGDRSL
jgi:hypothetical protein